MSSEPKPAVYDDLITHVCEQAIERLVERVPGATEESERAWFDEMITEWIRAQQPANVADVGEASEGLEFEYRTPEGEPLHRLTVAFEGAVEDHVEDAANVPEYDPPPLKTQRSGDMVQLWMRAAYEPWPDLPLERAAKVLSRSIGYSVPQPPLTHESVCLSWAHFDEMEARALAFELYIAGVDIEALLEQIEAFPYGEASLAWLTEPEECIHMHAALVDQMDAKERKEHPESLAHLRHNIEFIYRLSSLIPPHVRIWLRGWSAAYTHAAFARAVGLAPEE
jgi:hypothetical protein